MIDVFFSQIGISDHEPYDDTVVYQCIIDKAFPGFMQLVKYYEDLAWANEIAKRGYNPLAIPPLLQHSKII